MARFTRSAALAAVALAAVAPAAAAHKGNPDFRSDTRGLSPATRGVEVQVVNHDDSLELTNRSGRTVVVTGYRGEPYLRIGPSGSVAVNRRSPSHYLNDDRYAEGVEVPAAADPKAAPDWQEVDRTGRYTWHDHRIHWMARTVPPQVKDESERTKVFDWKVPVEVDGRPAAVSGSLIWVGRSGGGFPVAAGISLAAAVLAGALLVVVVRRRRGGPAKEAW
ncbi:MAG: hypothetical protein JW895_00315 [Thermoleophilaceae bacterium]|nr:hypothetical protein [Thermoleophilaceae bacterium]